MSRWLALRRAARSGLRLVEIPVLAWTAWDLALAAHAWPSPRPAPLGARKRRFRVVVPAHDEERVLADLLRDLDRQRYEPSHYSVVVVADHCADGTEVVAAERAEVWVRSAGPAGKGRALDWYLGQQPLEDDEALVVLDADNRVPPTMLGRFADELDAGHQVLQAYLDSLNPDDGPVARSAALSYWANNRMVQLSRANLGWSCDLGGTGMCVTAAALRAAGGFGTSLTEDRDLMVRLVLRGHAVRWLHDVRILDEKPRSAAVLVRQRARWASGMRQLARRHGWALIVHALRTRSLSTVDVFVRLVQPGRSMVGLATFALGGLAAADGRRSQRARVLICLAGVHHVVTPLLFLARDGVPLRNIRHYPVLAIQGALWLPIRVVGRLTRAWFHTPHGSPERPSSTATSRNSSA